MAKFSLKDTMNPESLKESISRKTEDRNIDISQIVPSADNEYSMDGIEGLAKNINIVGLLQSLVVCEREDGMFEIISGHRRFEACKLLVSQGRTDFLKIRCSVQPQDTEAYKNLQLLFANSDTRILTDYDKTMQAARIREQLEKLRDDGYEFKGRIREIVADMLKVSPAQMGRMESISKNLSPESTEAFKNGAMRITEAYEVSRKPPEQQALAVRKIKEAKENKSSRPKSEQKPKPDSEPTDYTQDANQLIGLLDDIASGKNDIDIKDVCRKSARLIRLLTT